MTLKGLHRWNGAIVVLFTTMHFTTHLSGIWGIDNYNTTQAFFRQIYQHPILEPIFIASVALQVLWGTWLLVCMVRRGLRGPWQKTQAFSGAVLVFFIVQHVLAFAITRWLQGLDTNFYWPASVLSQQPFATYFLPYYVAGVCALFVHLACFVRLVLLRTSRRNLANMSFWGLTMTGGVVAVLIVTMLKGGFYSITLPTEWANYLSRYW